MAPVNNHGVRVDVIRNLLHANTSRSDAEKNASAAALSEHDPTRPSTAESPTAGTTSSFDAATNGGRTGCFGLADTTSSDNEQPTSCIHLTGARFLGSSSSSMNTVIPYGKDTSALRPGPQSIADGKIGVRYARGRS